MKFHDELNPIIWDKDNDNQMRPEVNAKLREIADAFIEYIEIPEDALIDAVVTGSSASYNYNKFSDLDLHIIVDYDKIHENCPLIEGYLGALKNTFNKEHDIYIKDIPVELYAEKQGQGTVHNGLYSVWKEEWIDRPEKIAPTDNDAAVEAKYQEIKEMVDKCDDSETATELLEKIYSMRKAGLAEAGEFCTENLAFKKLRNEGCMDKLRQIKKEQIDKQLSLESYNEEDTNYTLFPSRGYRLKDHKLDSGALITTIWWRTEKNGMKDCRVIYFLGSEHHTGADHIYAKLIYQDGEKPYFKVFFPSPVGNYTTAQKYDISELENIEKILKNKNLAFNKSDLDKFLDFVNIMQTRVNKLNKTDKQLSLESYNESLKQDVKELTKTDDYYKVDGSRVSIKNGFGSQVELMDLQNLGKKLEKKGYKVYCSNYYIDAKKNESIKEEISDMIKQDIDNVMEVLKNDKKYYYDNHITSHVLYISVIKKRIPEFLGMMEQEVGDILSNLGYPVSYNPYGTGDNFVADEKMSYEDFQTWLKHIPYMLDKNESLNEDKLDLSKIKEQLKKLFSWAENIDLYINTHDFSTYWLNELQLPIMMVMIYCKNGEEAYKIEIGRTKVSVTLGKTDPAKYLSYKNIFTTTEFAKDYKTVDEVIADVLPIFNKIKDYIKDPKIAKIDIKDYKNDDNWEEKLSKFIASLPKKLGKKYDVHQTDETVYVNDEDKTVFIEPIEDSTQIIKIGLLGDDNMEITSEELELEDFGKEDVKSIMDTIKELFKTKNKSIKEDYTFIDEYEISETHGDWIITKDFNYNYASYVAVISNKYDLKVYLSYYDYELIKDYKGEETYSDIKWDDDKVPNLLSVEDALHHIGLPNSFPTEEFKKAVVDINDDIKANYDAYWDIYHERHGLLKPNKNESIKEELIKMINEAEGIYKPSLILEAYKKEQEWLKSLGLGEDERAPEIMLFIIENDEIKDTKLIKREDVYTYKPEENEYYLDMFRDSGDVLTDYNLEPAQKLVDRWNEFKKEESMENKNEDVATLMDKVDAADAELQELIKSLSLREELESLVEKALEE